MVLLPLQTSYKDNMEDNKRRKWNVGWGTVSLCNMNCQFCYSKFKRKEETDLTYDDWKKFVHENYQYIKSINYGTGENSLCEEWFDLLYYVRQNYPEIKQSVTTNGYISQAMENNNRKREVVIDSLDEFDISLDYADLEKHNKFRNQNNAGKWVLNTLKFCREFNKETTIVCLGSKVNMYMENIDGLFKIAKEYGCKIRVNIYRPTEGVNEFSKQFIWEPRELVDILYQISDKYKVLAISDAFLANVLTEKNEKDPSGIDSIRILPDGSITPSTYLISDDFIIGNIKQREVLKDLDKNAVLLKRIKEVIPNECKGCSYEYQCKGGVIDRRYLWYGSLEYKDPYCVFEPESMRKIALSEDKFESVHYGYLPTLFFAPK